MDDTDSMRHRTFSYVIALSATIFAVGTFGIAICTPPISGPFAAELSTWYPFTDTADRFPRDFFWMYPAMALHALYCILVACIHENTGRDKRLFSRIGTVFSAVAASILIVDYFVQITVVQPSLLNGEFDGIGLLSQYNPHGIFIALEEIGFIFMSLSFLALAPVFFRKEGSPRAIGWVLGIAFVLALASLIGISLGFGLRREYRFEVAIISINWLTLIIFGVLISIQFKKRGMRF